MTFQAAVKTSPYQHGASIVTFGDPEARAGYVRGPQVFWYKLVEDDEIFDPVGWKRGGAWAAAQEQREVDYSPEDDSADAERW